MKKITKLADLLEALPHCSGKDYVSIAKKLDLNSSEFEAYSFWSDEHYTRNCIARSDDYELILLCWEPGQKTPIHGHGGEECWVLLLQGAIEETRYELDADKQPQALPAERMSAGKISYMNDMMGLHSLHNIGKTRAMSLHLYMNPIDQCRVYQPSKQQLKVKELSYYSLEGQLLDKELV